MNTVYTKQNILAALEVQATARYYYDKADLLDIFYWLGIFITMILKLVFKNSIIVDYILIGWFLLTMFLDYLISKYTAHGADLKQLFDAYVFNWIEKIPERNIFSENLGNNINKEWFKLQINNSGSVKQSGVKDWYDIVDIDMDQDEAIKTAMYENVLYDSKINSTLITILLIIVLITFISFSDSTLAEYLVSIFLIMSSLTKKIIVTAHNVIRVNKLNSEIKLRLTLAKDTDEYKCIQNILYTKRKISSVSPNWIYQFQKMQLIKFTSSLLK